MCQKQEDTEEVLQDVLVKIWEKYELYDSSKGKLYTWMLNIARNAAIDRMRSKYNKQNAKTDSQEDYVHIDKGDLSLKPEHIGVKDLINVLEKDQKKVMDLAYFKAYTQKEIAKELNMPLGTVKTKVRSALKYLKNYLKDEY